MNTSTLQWKRRLGRSWGQWTVRPDRKVILLYHSIGRHAPALGEERFREQMDWLAANARIVTLPDLLLPDPAEGLQVAVSFDDGYASVHDAAAPVLRSHGASGTVYVNTGRMGDRTRHVSDASQGHYPQDAFMLWDEVAALHRAGWIIGSHGVEHLDLTVAEPSVAQRELRESREHIEARLGIPCQHFAYTWGRFTPRLQELVKQAGYASAVAGLHGALTPRSDGFALPRIDVRAEYELSDFISVVTGAWDYLGMKQRLLRRVA